jgi:catechol 2,3-dioxygenase-like lactoylglutathione lyase family enzyme
MLATARLVGFIPTRDADRARAFYESTLGLRFVHDCSYDPLRSRRQSRLG